MKRVKSTQVDVAFVWCPDPITLDKRGSWGPAEENVQRAPNGAFLKMRSPMVVGSLVQPNADKTAPIGWVPGSSPGLFDKAPIWIENEVLEAGARVAVQSLDNAEPIIYDVTEPSVVCYNDLGGAPNMGDGWCQKLSGLRKNYVLEE